MNYSLKQIGYLQQPDGSVVMVNLANTVTTSPVKQTQSTGKLININESALLQQARIQRIELFRYSYFQIIVFRPLLMTLQ